MPVYIESVLPCRAQLADRNPKVLDYNKQLKRLANQYGYKYLDLHLLMIDHTGQLKQEYSSDGIHLTPAAYEVWKHEMDKVLGAPIEPLPTADTSTTSIIK